MAAESVSGDTPLVTELLTVLVTELLTVGGPVVEVLFWNADGRYWRSSAKE